MNRIQWPLLEYLNRYFQSFAFRKQLKAEMYLVMCRIFQLAFIELGAVVINKSTQLV